MERTTKYKLPINLAKEWLDKVIEVVFFVVPPGLAEATLRRGMSHNTLLRPIKSGD